MKRILCFFGIHDLETTENLGAIRKVRCKRCGKRLVWDIISGYTRPY